MKAKNMQKLNTFSNDEYMPGNIIKRIIWYVFSELFINTMIPFPIKMKIFILKIFGAKIGKGVVIKPNLKIKYPWFLFVGANSWIGEEVWIDNLDFVHIANDVCISQGAMIITGSHNYNLSSFNLITKEIKIESGVWICAKSIVLQGVVCGNGSMLSSGSVANKNLDPNSIYVGNPAIKLKNRDNLN
tara:strand:+ start:7989 stop:8549 length:561 start_codon:yes stop_codon:yes gene_type:complete